MTEREELGRFLVGLASEMTNNVTRGLQNVSQSFTNQLAGLLIVIHVQEVCVISRGMTTNQTGLLTRPAGVL